MDKKYILNETQAALKIKRMALEILERNAGVPQLILAGVAPNGSIMAAKLKEIMKGQFAEPILIQTIELDKKHPSEIRVSPEMDVNGKVVIIVDDVANSGKTLTYAIKPYLEGYPKSIQTLVLVNRTHKQFPIQADFVGISLSSTMQEYIDLDVEGDTIKGAWMQ